jgi:hypothetical protein
MKASAGDRRLVGGNVNSGMVLSRIDKDAKEVEK